MIGLMIMVGIWMIGMLFAERERRCRHSLEDPRLGQLAILPEETDEANRAALTELTHEIRGARGRIVEIDQVTGVVTRQDD